MKPVNVAVVGATGAVGEAMIEILESREFPVDTLYPLASADPPASPCSFAASITRCRISAPLIFPRRRLDCFQPVVISAPNMRRLQLRRDAL